MVSFQLDVFSYALCKTDPFYLHGEKQKAAFVCQKMGRGPRGTHKNWVAEMLKLPQRSWLLHAWVHCTSLVSCLPND